MQPCKLTSAVLLQLLDDWLALQGKPVLECGVTWSPLMLLQSTLILSTASFKGRKILSSSDSLFLPSGLKLPSSSHVLLSQREKLEA